MKRATEQALFIKTTAVFMYAFGFQKEVGPVSVGASTTPGFPLHKDHACTGHVLLTRGMHHKLLAHFLQPISSLIGSLLTVVNPSHGSVKISRTSSSTLVSNTVYLRVYLGTSDAHCTFTVGLVNSHKPDRLRSPSAAIFRTVANSFQLPQAIRFTQGGVPWAKGHSGTLLT